MEMTFDAQSMSLSSGELAVFEQLFISGPTWDGDLISKEGRNDLVNKGLAVRVDGWQTLTDVGFAAAMSADYGKKKQAWQSRRSS